MIEILAKQAVSDTIKNYNVNNNSQPYLNVHDFDGLVEDASIRTMQNEESWEAAIEFLSNMEPQRRLALFLDTARRNPLNQTPLIVAALNGQEDEFFQHARAYWQLRRTRNRTEPENQ